MRSNIGLKSPFVVSQLLCVLVFSSVSRGAETPSAELALSFRPVFKDVPYERVSKEDYGDCKVEVERQGKVSGWVVFGPEGQVLRRFWDTNSDNVVDQWRYYDRGYEVYRDIDSDFNNKVDQARWLNIAGTRWAIDKNEDGKIDKWKAISAEEASREAVRAMADQDAHRLSLVLLSDAEIKELGLAEDLAAEIREQLENPAETMKSRVSQSKVVNKTTEWLRFDSSMLIPYQIPADEGKSKLDLTVYENVMAIVETNGETGFIQLGEMVQVGQSWKLTQIPQPIEGDTLEMAEGGTLMQPSAASASPGTPVDSEITPEMRELLTRLQELDSNAPTPQSSAAELARYNSQRVEVLRKLLAESTTEEERTQWLTQLIEGLAAAVQTGKYPEGVTQLASIESDLKKQRPNSDLIPYAAYRRLLAEYTVKLQTTSGDNEEREEIQKWWLSQLQSFVSNYAQSEDAADALLQLAITEEFSGDVETAKKWYSQLASDHPKTDAGQRAQGALRRLNLVGNQLTLQGKGLNGQTVSLSDYRGKAVLVIFWATWCQPCTEDLPQIKALYDQYRSRGFEIVGINLDTRKEVIQPYINQHGNSWPHILEQEGLEGELAVNYGVISVPTMFLVDQQGKVVSNSTSVDDLKEELPELLK